jgi:hypothetical protein
LVRKRFSDAHITEAHPKALLWLLGLASTETPVDDVSPSALSAFVALDSRISEHERDAALGALTAWAMLHAYEGWRDISKDESGAMHPWDTPVSYWMPI